jgi:hypothetical protein
MYSKENYLRQKLNTGITYSTIIVVIVFKIEIRLENELGAKIGLLDFPVSKERNWHLCSIF